MLWRILGVIALESTFQRSIEVQVSTVQVSPSGYFWGWDFSPASLSWSWDSYAPLTTRTMGMKVSNVIFLKFLNFNFWPPSLSFSAYFHLVVIYHPRISFWLPPAPNKHEPWICWKLMWINPTNVIVPCLLSWVSEPDASYEYPLAWNFSLPLTFWVMKTPSFSRK